MQRDNYFGLIYQIASDIYWHHVQNVECYQIKNESIFFHWILYAPLYYSISIMDGYQWQLNNKNNIKLVVMRIKK